MPCIDSFNTGVVLVLFDALALKHSKKVICRQEIDRIERSEAHEGMPPLACTFDRDLGPDSLKVMRRVKDVVLEIAKHDESTWPDDAYWSASLPDWLTSSMPALSQDDYLRLMSDTPREEWRTLPWQLESWVGAVAERGWKWWSAVVVGSEASIVLEIVSAPARTAAFRPILLAAGATILAETY